MKILLLDHNHPLITEQLLEKGFILEEDFTSSYDEVLKKINRYDGIIIRSRIPLDKNFLENAKNLKFIARVGAGMENIDKEVAKNLGIELINSPEGNRDSVAEHVVAMLLILMNRLFIASNEVKNGIWKREENRGDELLGKTFGIIGYLPGLEEKFKIYNHPLIDSLDYIIRTEHKRKRNKKAPDVVFQQLDDSEVTARIEQMISNYGIETMWVGEMRGRTLSNSFIIIDEAQNMSNKTMQMVLSRIDSSCKVVVLGSNKQIDNFYVNKYTNALTTLLKSTKNEDNLVNIFAIKLEKVLRGPITEWAEQIFSK
jgi:hypothetical protein